MTQTMISIAKSQIGVKEADGGDDKYIKWYGGLPLTSSWCAVFVSWCANQALLLGETVPKFASCDAGMKWYKDRHRWEPSKAYGGTYVPKQNDLIFFSKGHNEKDATHVGIVDAVGNHVVLTVEGNSSDMVRSRSYDLSDAYILGYGVTEPVKYANTLNDLVGDLQDTPVLRRGSKGQVVKELQKVLIAKGCSCGVKGADGNFGPGTEEGVKHFQRVFVGMSKPDGILDAGGKTWATILKL